MTLEDLAFYQALEEVDPSDEARADWRAAVQAYVTYAVLRCLSKRPTPRRKVEDFLVVRPPTARRNQATTVKDMQGLMRGLHEQMQEAKK